MPIPNFQIMPRLRMVTQVLPGSLAHHLWLRVYYGAQFPREGRYLRVEHAVWSVIPERMLETDWADASAVLGVNLRALSAQEELTRHAALEVRLAVGRAARYRMMRTEIEPLPLPG